MTRSISNNQFDDFLGLRSIHFRRTRLIVFTGVSGSGKSTALDFLCHEHPAFTERPKIFKNFAIGHVAPVNLRNHVVVIDEIDSRWQLRPILALLRRGNTVIVASHVAAVNFLPFAILWRTKLFATDGDAAKIVRYLNTRNVRFTEQVVQRYCRVYGANYLDIEHILERFPSTDFDRAFLQFQKFCRLEKSPMRGER